MSICPLGRSSNSVSTSLYFSLSLSLFLSHFTCHGEMCGLLDKCSCPVEERVNRDTRTSSYSLGTLVLFFPVPSPQYLLSIVPRVCPGLLHFLKSLLSQVSVIEVLLTVPTEEAAK